MPLVLPWSVPRCAPLSPSPWPPREELKRPENAGLAPALKLLESVKAQLDEELKDKGGPVSYADLIQFGGTPGVGLYRTLSKGQVCVLF